MLAEVICLAYGIGNICLYQADVLSYNSGGLYIKNPAFAHDKSCHITDMAACPAIAIG
ncbi:MAG: hypothetical protein WC782_13000 [Methylococcaceae bacterium]|jgi:hypothetical protein